MIKKNIAILINSLSAGGAGRVVSRIAAPLEEYYNVYVLLLDTEKILYKCGGRICNVGGNGKTYYGKVLRSVHLINKIIQEERIECVISFLDMPNLINVLCVHNCKRIISLRCFFYKQIYTGLKGKIELGLFHLFFKKADGVVPVSKALGEYSITHLGVDKSKVYVIENAYNVDEIVAMSCDDVEVEVKEFISKNKTSVAVGRLDYPKGYPLLLQSFSLVCKEEPKAGLIILGEGSLRNELENMVKDLGIQDRVLFMGNKKNPFAYIAKSELFVSASLVEGFPNALVEAMACGVPVIHTDCLTGPREILSDTYTEKNIKEKEYSDYGILMPDFSRVDSLGIEQTELISIYADTWIEMLKNSELQKKYGILAQKRAREYSMEKCVKKYFEMVESVLKQK